jgi:hypothetical protein
VKHPKVGSLVPETRSVASRLRTHPLNARDLSGLEDSLEIFRSINKLLIAQRHSAPLNTEVDTNGVIDGCSKRIQDQRI